MNEETEPREEFGVEETEALGIDSDHVEAEPDSEEAGEDFSNLEEQAKAAWEEEDEATPPQGGVVVGLSPLGPVVQVTSPTGDSAQKVVSVEELYLLGGQMIGIASFLMGMGMQAQMQEQARINQLIEQGEEQTKSGLYVRRH